ncbi:MAG: hypothetical protein R3Y65_00090 [Bacillota bacterium]
MPVYQMRQPIQYYKPNSRKDGVILPVGNKVPYIIWILLLMASFAFAELFMTKMTMNSYMYLFSDYIYLIETDAFYFSILGMVAVFETVFLYCVVSIYNFIARWYLRGENPCETRELFRNLVPFFIVRNIIWGGLSLSMFIPSGVFVSIGLALFEMLATMIIFFPAFKAIKKRYIKQGYGREILQAYAVPYIIMQATFLIF